MKTETKRAELLEFAKELKGAGYKVYSPVNTTTWCHFVKDDKIGYVDYGGWGFNFSSVHRPCRECGTGFGIHRNVTPTVAMAEDCLIFAPSWASGIDRQAIKKYKNWEDYASHPSNTWSPQMEL